MINRLKKLICICGICVLSITTLSFPTVANAEEYVDNIDFIVSLEFRNTFRDETIFSFAKIPEKVAPIHCQLLKPKG